jgi:uncharacterized membrane protein
MFVLLEEWRNSFSDQFCKQGWKDYSARMNHFCILFGIMHSVYDAFQNFTSSFWNFHQVYFSENSFPFVLTIHGTANVLFILPILLK